MARGRHYAKLSLSNAARLSFSDLCILLFLFLSLCRLCVCVFLCSHWSLVDVPLIFFVQQTTYRNTVQEGGCRFMAAWVREEENASNQRQKKRDAEEADKVEVAPGVTVASLRRFRTALIGPTQRLPKRRRLCR